MHRFCLEGKERKKELVWRLERGFIGHYDAAWAGSFGRFKLNICTCLFCICQETFYSSRLFISSRRARTCRAANPRNVGLPKFLAVGYRALDASAHCFWLHANTRSNQCNATPCFFENQRFALYRYCSIWSEQYKYQYYKLFIYAYITVHSHVSPINTLRNHYSFQFSSHFFSFHCETIINRQ